MEFKENLNPCRNRRQSAMEGGTAYKGGFALLEMMNFLPLLLAGTALLLVHAGFASAGQPHVSLKGFSDEEIQGLRNGEGMGLAKIAELNHYPGPRHVLDLADRLNLSEKQRAETQKIFDKMHEEAVRLGKLLIEKEQELENLFAKKHINENEIKTLVLEIARLRGELRFVHLRAHIRMKPILSPEQIIRYDLLRGYSPHTREVPRHHRENP
ncbi:MAG: periplasmic heavy metal sensor [Deltaproteobacteria bacterium]|nr:periplasmic heavy metal sensor [Deltaproteobacteria bacterium]